MRLDRHRPDGGGNRERRFRGHEGLVGEQAQPFPSRGVEVVPSGGQPEIEVDPGNAVGSVEEITRVRADMLARAARLPTVWGVSRLARIQSR